MKTKTIIATTAALIGLFIFQSSFTFQTNPKGGSDWKAPTYADTIKNPVSKNVITDGKAIFEKLCWTCHGKAGKGDGPGSANLKPKPANLTSADVQKQTDGAIFWKITNGKGQMASYAKIYKDKERWQLVNYIRTLAPAKQK